MHYVLIRVNQDCVQHSAYIITNSKLPLSDFHFRAHHDVTSCHSMTGLSCPHTWEIEGVPEVFLLSLSNSFSDPHIIIFYTHILLSLCISLSRPLSLFFRFRYSSHISIPTRSPPSFTLFYCSLDDDEHILYSD